MQISVSTEYAIHSILYMAMHKNHRIVLVSEIGSAQNIPISYLAKVFRILAKTGVVRSFRGSKGGYSLAKSPDQITIREVVEAMEGRTALFESLGERRGCKAGVECKIQETFQAAHNKMYQELERVTFQDLVDDAMEHVSKVEWLVNNPPSKRDF
jgi:Rrf2 family iron-sulfur cluster assembly transcriptional regulator